MAYCTNCGNQLREGAKFCDSCGKSVNSVNDSTQRQTVFEGKIHKCPNCGEIVEAFQDDCPTCGYQFRNAQATSSVKVLADKLERIANEKVERNFWGKVSVESMNAKVQKQVQLIQNFAIPNTYEDLWEFLILSSSNITDSTNESPEQNALSKAWKSKFSQAYNKAKLVMDNPEDVKKIDKLYAEKIDEITTERKHHFISGISKDLPFVILIVMGFISFMALGIGTAIAGSNYNKEVEKENERLASIVEEVYACIDNGNYTLARVKAANISFNYSSSYSSNYKAIAENWDETRENLLKIIDEAEQESKKQANTGGE